MKKLHQLHQFAMLNGRSAKTLPTKLQSQRVAELSMVELHKLKKFRTRLKEECIDPARNVWEGRL
jgi:hypothetical protein